MITRSSSMNATKPRSWSDLPYELLSLIAYCLNLIDLLSFRAVCRDFRHASSTASAQIDADREPWLLLYRPEASKCLLYPEKDKYKRYTIDIPQLQGAKCLASYQGWLLLLKNGSIFFFCPFSQATIRLPDFPRETITDQIASFSTEPTSPDCIVSVINGLDDSNMEVHVISRGERNWSQHKVKRSRGMDTIAAATFDHHSRTFYYMDQGKSLLTFSLKTRKWTPYVIITGDPNMSHDPLPYYFRTDTFRNTIKDDRSRFELEEDEYVTVCGTTFGKDYSPYPILYVGEDIGVPTENVAKKRERKALWVQPRFFQVDSGQIW